MPFATSLDFESLLSQAQRGDKQAKGEIFDQMRSYLNHLAERQMDARLGVRLDPEDFVQETYVTALRCFSQFRGHQQPQFFAWLQKVHTHVVDNQARKHIHTGKRSVKSEDPIGSRLPQVAVAGDSTPSGKMMRGELIMKLVLSMDTLPEDQREAIRWRYIENLPLSEIAIQMQRSTQSVAGLLKRGLEALRARLGKDL